MPKWSDSRRISRPAKAAAPVPQLPLDPDIEVLEGVPARPRPVHLAPGNIALVALGGAIGTGLRYLIGELVPLWQMVPIATAAINVVGAFVLGALLEMLSHRGADTGWNRRLRLGVGTGVLGGFTTYSSLATDTAVLTTGHLGLAACYALGTVLLGTAASIAGIASARALFGDHPTEEQSA